MQIKWLIPVLVLLGNPLFSQEIQVREDPKVIARDTTFPDEEYLPLKPARAAFYSAVLPGLGQAYNKDYWKIPIVYGVVGSGVGVAVFNQDLFQKYRTAYKDRIGGRIDEFTTVDEQGNIINRVFTEEQLIRAQDFYRRRKELAILVTAGLYVLQIIEANVDAHLAQYDVEDRLSFSPFLERNEFDFTNNFGIRITYSF